VRFGSFDAYTVPSREMRPDRSFRDPAYACGGAGADGYWRRDLDLGWRCHNPHLDGHG
jgi:hypothetical protein